jgi:uncharacterized protein (TIGR03437 family)
MMKFFLAYLGLISIIAAYSYRASCAQNQSFNLMGRWRVEFKFSGDRDHTLRFNADSQGKGSFLLLDAISNLIPPPEPTKSQWEQPAPDQVTFSGDIEFPIGNVGRDAGTLVFKGRFESADSISGTVAFFRAGQDPKDPGTVPAKSGDFTAKRATTSSATNVSAASYKGDSLASGAIVTAFGSNLAMATQSATSLPLPDSLAGTTVKVRLGSGAEFPAPLFYVSKSQVNYLLPAGTVSDAATITITSADGNAGAETLRISEVAPGLFSANSTGDGVAAAYLVRDKSDGARSYESVAQFDAAQNKFVPLPIDLGPDRGSASDRVYLILFGTGIQGRSAMSAVRATIGGVVSEVLYAGSQGDFAGVDQINLYLQRSLAGRGVVDVALVVDGKDANIVQISFR